MEVNKIYKPQRFDNYTVIPSAIFRHQGISVGATGLYCWLFSHKSGFTITVQYIIGHFKEGKDSINARIKELVAVGFLVRKEVRQNGKFAGYNYFLNDTPTTVAEKTVTGKTAAENTVAVNPQQSNSIYNNIYNNNNSTIIDNNKVLLNKVKGKIEKPKKTFADFDPPIQSCFLNIVELFPEETRPKTKDAKRKWVQIIDDLWRKDKHHPRKVYILTQRARQDNFWAQNYLSITKLRKRNKDDIKYIDLFDYKFGKDLKNVNWEE